MRIKVFYERDRKGNEEIVKHTGVWVDTVVVPIKGGEGTKDGSEWRAGHGCCVIVNSNDGRVELVWPEFVTVKDPANFHAS